MKGNLVSLLKVQFINGFGVNKFLHEKDEKKKHRTLAMILVMGFVVVMIASYSFVLSYSFGSIGISYVIPGYAFTISSIVTLFFTFLKTNGVLLASKDYDMLMSFPIPTATVITAKFLSMYINNLAFIIVVMGPMAVGYACWNTVSFMTVLTWLITILFTPLLPMTIAAIIGICIAAIGSGFKHKVFVQMFLTVALVGIILSGSFWMNSMSMKDESVFIDMITNIGEKLSHTLHAVYPLSAWFDSAVNDGNIVALFLLIAVSVLIYGIFALICGKCYGKINSALQSHHATSNYKIGRLKSSSLTKALVQKEAKRFFSSPIYMINMGMGLILALILSVGSFFVGIDTFFQGIDNLNFDAIRPVIGEIMPFIIAMIVNMCNTSAVSLSLEGKNLWVVQSLPISLQSLLKGKMLFNIIMVLPVSLICSLVFIIEFRVNVVMILLYILFSVVSVLFSTVWGTWINLHFPNYKWQNEVEVIKQGIASMVAIVGGMLIYLVMVSAAFFLSSIMNIEFIILGFSVIMSTIGGILYKHCKKSAIVKILED